MEELVGLLGMSQELGSSLNSVEVGERLTTNMCYIQGCGSAWRGNNGGQEEDQCTRNGLHIT